MLNKLRSRNIDVKANFKKKFTFDNVEKLECSLGCSEIEDQEHLLSCKPLLNELRGTGTHVSYKDLFSNIRKQKVAIEHFISLLDARNKLLNL